MIFHKLLELKKDLKQEIESIDSQLKSLPEGKLICTKNGSKFKWLRRLKDELTTIPRKKRHLAEQLAKKKYLLARREELVQECTAIDFYIRHHREVKPSQQMLSPDSRYYELLAPQFSLLSQELSDWASSPYEKNTNYPEHLIHKTSSGNIVRSKSEALIDLSLFLHQIPFRYECPLQLGDIIIHPDFTIRHPVNGKTYYWEHMGQVDNPSYSKKVGNKIQTYIDHGIYPSIQLILTYETIDNPLTSDVIEEIIKKYFL